MQTVAQGNPVWVVIIAAVVMTFAALCMIGSPWISYKLASGNVLEAVTGMVTSWFGAATSTAISAYSAAAGAAINRQAEQVQIQGTTSAETVTAQSTRAAASTEARSRAAAESARSRATAQEETTNAAASAAAQNERALAGQERTERTERAGFEDQRVAQEGKVLAEQNKAEVAVGKAPYEVAKEIPLVGPIMGGGAETVRNVGAGLGATGRGGAATGGGQPAVQMPGRTPLVIGDVKGRENFSPPGAGNFSVQRDGRALMQAFQQQFGRPMPVNTGQRPIHNANGYDHRNSMDVGVKPNSPEGRWVRSYCAQNGIPYSAFTGPMTSKITGKTVASAPHIHVGMPSRITGKAYSIGTTLPVGERPPLQAPFYTVPNRTGLPFQYQSAVAPLDAARIESNYTLAAARGKTEENIDASRVETSRVIGANNYEASARTEAAWAADVARQRAIGTELGGSIRANQIRYDGSMGAISIRHEAMTTAAKMHAVSSVFASVGSNVASQMQSVFQQFNRY
jgi:hypothetical protein